MKEYFDEFFKLSEKKQSNLVVIGDSLLDEFFAVKCHRISPENPTKCLSSETDKPCKVVPGGSANLANQGKHFNVNVYLVSLLDSYAKKIFKSLNTEYSVVMETGKVPLKRRYYDGDFPLHRWDIETENYGEPDIEKLRKKIKNNFCKLVKKIKVDCVLFSDYSKGLLTEELTQDIIRLCNEKNITTIVDPKSYNANQWKNCTIFKPNANYVKEFCNLHGVKANGEKIKFSLQAKLIKNIINCKQLVITNSGDGLYISEPEQYLTFEQLSHKRPEIRSVSGAGDNFLAGLSFGISLGLDLVKSSYIAYNLSTVYIQNKYNRPITPYEFKKWIDPISSKIIKLDELIKLKEFNKHQNWVLVNGSFDLLHAQHYKLINHARSLGDRVIVAINTDEDIKKRKGEKRPINDLTARSITLANLQNTDFIISFGSENELIEIMKKVKFKYRVLGEDYRSLPITGKELTEVVFIPYDENYSSTKIVNKITSR